MVKPRGVLFVCPVGDRGGAESALWTLWRNLDRDRISPSIFFLRDGPFVDEVRELGLPVRVGAIARLLAPAAFIRTVRGIRRFALEKEVEVIVDSLGYAHLYGSLAARSAGLRTIWWDHALATSAQWLDRFASTLPTDLVITSSNRAQEAHRVLHRAAKCCVVHPGVEVEHWRLASTAGLNGARRKFRIDSGAVVISTIGRLEYGKGQDILIDAAQDLVTDFPDLRFLLVGGSATSGDRAFARRLVQRTEEMRLQNHVQFLGARQDVPAILGLTDIFVHPARHPESFGLAILEAMVCGKPIVATRVGGPEELLGDGWGGLLISSGDAQALAEALRTLIRNRPYREELGRRAGLLSQTYDAGRMVESFYRAIEEVFN